MSQWITENPFYVLELRTKAGAAEVEAQAERLLAAQKRGLAGAYSYATPLGPQARDAHKIRRALADLGDSGQRPLHELWARLPPRRKGDRPYQADPLAPWPEALSWFGK